MDDAEVTPDPINPQAEVPVAGPVSDRVLAIMGYVYLPLPEDYPTRGPSPSDLALLMPQIGEKVSENNFHVTDVIVMKRLPDGTMLELHRTEFPAH